jgi:hypothetical protein
LKIIKGKNMKLNVMITGITPMLIHNGRTANPLNSFSKALKALTSKRKKTDEDIQEILALQWEASLYWNDKIGLYMPVENILASLLKACKKHKLGPSISGFVFNETLGFPIITANHDNFRALKADPENKFVKAVTIQKSKTITCRCILKEWKLQFNCDLDGSIIDANDVRMIIQTMSNRIGLGVWTPSHPKPGIFGKFQVDTLEIN